MRLSLEFFPAPIFGPPELLIGVGTATDKLKKFAIRDRQRVDVKARNVDAELGKFVIPTEVNRAEVRAKPCSPRRDLYSTRGWSFSKAIAASAGGPNFSGGGRFLHHVKQRFLMHVFVLENHLKNPATAEHDTAPAVAGTAMDGIENRPPHLIAI